MQRLPRFQYHAPGTMVEATSLLAEYGDEAKIIAGGTDVLLSMKRRLFAPGHLISLSAVDELGFLEYDEEKGLRIGPAVTLMGLVESSSVREKYPALLTVARRVGSIQIRNIGTVGGNLCLNTRCWFYNQSQFWRQSRPLCYKTGGEVCHVVEGSKRCFAAYSGDLAPLLIVLGAEMRLTKKGAARVISLKGFFTGDGIRPNVLEGDEVVSEVLVPPAVKGDGAAYIKLRLRDEVDFPILGVGAAVKVRDGICEDAKVVVNAVSPAPVEVEGAGEALAGKRPGNDDIEKVAQAAKGLAHPVANTASTPDYRRRMVPVLVKQAIGKALAAGGCV